MSIGDIAGLIAAGFFAILVILLAVPIIKLGKVFDELRHSVKDLTEETTPILQETATTVRNGNQQLERVDAITSNVQDATANVASVTSLSAAVVGRPLIRAASFTAGVRAALTRRRS